MTKPLKPITGFAPVKNGSYGANFLAVDDTGSVFSVYSFGAPCPGMCKLTPAATTWVPDGTGLSDASEPAKPQIPTLDFVNDAAGNLYGTGNGAGGSIVRRLVGATTWTKFDNGIAVLADGPTGVTPGNLAGLHLGTDDAGNVYVSISAGFPDCRMSIYRLTPGATQWTVLGSTVFAKPGCVTGLAVGTTSDTLGNVYTFGHDTSGSQTIYGCYRLPAGGSQWSVFNARLPGATGAVTGGNKLDGAGTLFANLTGSTSTAVYSLSKGGTSWTGPATAHPQSNLVRDGAGTLVGVYAGGNMVMTLPMGASTWTTMTVPGLASTNGTTHIVIDGDGRLLVLTDGGVVLRSTP